MKYQFGAIKADNKQVILKHRHTLAVLGCSYDFDSGEDFDFLADLYEGHPDIYPRQVKLVEFVSHPGHGGAECGALVLDDAGMHHPFLAYDYGLMPTLTFYDEGLREAHWALIKARKRRAKMRVMVREQTRRPLGARCHCGAPAVDMNHVGVSFKTIRDTWQPFGPLDIDDDTLDGSDPRFVDDGVHQDWLDWHQRHATLVAVCKPCHKAYTYR